MRWRGTVARQCYLGLQFVLLLTALQSGSVLQGHSANGVTDLISAIATFAESVTAMKGLVHPLVRLHDLDEGPGCFEVRHIE